MSSSSFGNTPRRPEAALVAVAARCAPAPVRSAFQEIASLPSPDAHLPVAHRARMALRVPEQGAASTSRRDLPVNTLVCNRITNRRQRLPGAPQEVVTAYSGTSLAPVSKRRKSE